MKPALAVSFSILSAALMAQTPLASLDFRDVDGGVEDLADTKGAPTILHGVSTGWFEPSVPVPAGVLPDDLIYAWAFFQAGVLVDLIERDDYLSLPMMSLTPAGATHVTLPIPYGLDVGSNPNVVPQSYALNGAGQYELEIWVGDSSMVLTGTQPPSGFLAHYSASFTVVQPEVTVAVPSHNSLTAGCSFQFSVELTQTFSYDRYFAVSGSGGVTPNQATGVIYAGSDIVILDAVCHYPSGRLVVSFTDDDGSADGGDDSTHPVLETYVSPQLQGVSMKDLTSLDGPPNLVESELSKWPFLGEVNPRPPTGAHTQGTECKHPGGKDPNPTGMPNFSLCGPCKTNPDGNDRKICQGDIPGSHEGLVSEPVCGPAKKWKATASFRLGGHFETDPSKRCVITEKNEPVLVYKLDSSGTEDCPGLFGISFSVKFFGLSFNDPRKKYCCYYSSTQKDDVTMPVRRCTTE